MKKMICLCVIFLGVFGLKVSAAVGDVVSEIYTTDILTFVDDTPIKGYSINGKTMICLEDLENYGFSVTYDDSIRTLIVNKTGEKAENFNPYFERGIVGGTAGYVYDTDIIAIVNGEKANAYSINGRMVAAVEDLGSTVYSYFDQKTERRITNCGMTYKYDDSERKLWLNTNELWSKEQDYEYYKSQYEKGIESNYESGWKNIIVTDDYAVQWGHLVNPRGDDSFLASIVYKGQVAEVPLTGVLQRYGTYSVPIRLYWGENNNILFPSFKLENGKLLFNVTENDVYEINPYTLQVWKCE